MHVKAQTFQAVLERDDRTLGWTVARLPFDPATAWPTLLRQRVRGKITGPSGAHAFRTSLFAWSNGSGFYLLVNRTMQQQAGLMLGMQAAFQLEPDLEPRPAELPQELDALLDEAEGLRLWYATLTEYMRREIGKWITGVKGDEARLRRAEQMAERLLSTMEAEIDLPPALERAFRNRPQARAGWERTPPSHRRAELFALFYYKLPEAREKRLQKLCDAAEKRAR